MDDAINPQAAWFYPHPSPLARKIKGRVAFWQGVRIESVGEPAAGRERAAPRR